jgi:methylmalonyl-CoA/ethylmalonyl-CoA epimerase
MVKAASPLINITNIEQMCIAVHDVDKSMESLWQTFGIGPWDVAIVHAAAIRDLTYHGKPGSFGFKAANSRQKINGYEIELMEPLEGENDYRDFLNEYGEGVHHVRAPKIDTLDAFKKAVQSLEKAGFPCVMSGRCTPGTFAYIDTRKVLGTKLEIYWLDPSAAWPPRPDYVFPK